MRTRKPTSIGPRSDGADGGGGAGARLGLWELPEAAKDSSPRLAEQRRLAWFQLSGAFQGYHCGSGPLASVVTAPKNSAGSRKSAIRSATTLRASSKARSRLRTSCQLRLADLIMHDPPLTAKSQRYAGRLGVYSGNSFEGVDRWWSVGAGRSGRRLFPQEQTGLSTERFVDSGRRGRR